MCYVHSYANSADLNTSASFIKTKNSWYFSKYMAEPVSYGRSLILTIQSNFTRSLNSVGQHCFIVIWYCLQTHFCLLLLSLSSLSDKKLVQFLTNLVFTDHGIANSI